LGCAATSIERTPHGVVVNYSHGRRDTYDHVVIASHSDQPLAMLSDADDRERAILGAIGYATNTIYYLHRDIRLVSAVWCSRHSRAHFRARLCQDTRNPAKQFPRGLAAPDAIAKAK
jgi:predicted NAD/FAD-binding protein